MKTTMMKMRRMQNGNCDQGEDSCEHEDNIASGEDWEKEDSDENVNAKD